MQSKLMNKYFKNSPNHEVITEGWGYFISLLIPGVNFIQLIRTGNFGAKVASDPKFKQYIREVAPKVVAQVKKENPNAIPAKKIEKSNERGFMSGYDGTTTKEKMTNWKAGILCEGYVIHVISDTTHIQKVVLIFLDKKTHKYFGKPLPAPSKGDLKKVYHEE